MQDNNDFSLVVGDVINDLREKTGDVVRVTEQELESSTWLLGVQGTGKSSLIEYYVWQFANRNPKKGIIVVDPHGDLVTNMIKQLPEDRVKDTYLLDISDKDYFFGINIFDAKDVREGETGQRDSAIDRVVDTFFKMFEGSDRGVMLPKVLRFITSVMIANAGMSLADVPRLLKDEDFREELLKQVSHYWTLEYWREYGEMSARAKGDETRSLNNRLQTLLSMELIEYIMGQEQTTIDFRQAMDTNEILLIRLPVADEPIIAPLIGTALVTEMYRTVFSYSDTPRDQRRGFTLFVDEAHNFVTDQFARLITEGRKYGLRLFIGNQTHSQLKGRNYNEILNCRTRVSLRLNDDDAREMASSYFDKDKKPALKSITWDVLPELKKRREYEIFQFNRDVLDRLYALQKELEDEKEVEKVTHTLKSIELLLQSAELGQNIDDFLDTALRWCGRFFGFSGYYLAVDRRDKAREVLNKMREDHELLNTISLDDYIAMFLTYYCSDAEGYKRCGLSVEVVNDAWFWGYVKAVKWQVRGLTEEHVVCLDRMATYHKGLELITVDTMIDTITRSGFVWERTLDLHIRNWRDFAKKHEIIAEDSRMPWVLRDFHSQWAERIQQTSFDFTRIPTFAYLKLTEKGQTYISPLVRGWFWFRSAETHKVRTNREPWRTVTERFQLFDKMMVYTRNETFGEDLVLPSYYIDPDLYARYCTSIPRGGFEIACIEKSFTCHPWVSAVFTDKTLQYAHADELKIAVGQKVWNWFITEHGDKMYGHKSFFLEVVKKQKEENELLSETLGTVGKIKQYRAEELQARIQKGAQEIAKQEVIVASFATECQRYEDTIHTFRDKLLSICTILQNDPIGEYEKKETVSDLAVKISKMLERIGFVRVGGKVSHIRTPDRPPQVDDDEYDRRITIIREQTRKKYCKSREEIEKSLRSKRQGETQGLQKQKKEVYSDDEDYSIDINTDFEVDDNE